MAGEFDIVNAKLIVREFYTAVGCAVRAQVGDNLFIPDFPTLDQFNGLTTKGIVMTATGGTIIGQRMASIPYQMKCFGGAGGIDEAHVIERAVINQTMEGHGTALTTGRVIGAQIEVSGQELKDPDILPSWPYVLIQIRIQVGPNTV